MQTGVVCDGSHPAIRWNTLRYNNTAINCGNYGSPSIRENMIKNNTNGVTAAFNAVPGIANTGTVAIRVYDVAGRLVRELVNGIQVAGSHEAVWEGIDRRGSPVASGIYFVKMDAGRESFTRKMVLIK